MTTTKKSNQQRQQQHQPLLTPASVALSLAPPRVPPHGSLLRKLYTHPNAAHPHAVLQNDKLGHHNTNDERDDSNRGYQSHTLTSRLLQLFTSSSGRIFLLHHPHLPTSLSLPEQLTRFLGAVLPLDFQHSFRDDGYFKSVLDGIVTLSCPLVAVGHWREAREFLELSHSLSLPGGKYNANIRGSSLDDVISNKNEDEVPKLERKWRRKRIAYGEHAMQYFDLFLPSKNSSNSTKNASDITNSQNKNHKPTDNEDGRIPVRGTLFFVHGGAWGSGHPWMYRLVAPTFLKLNFAVVIVGYRTYPEAQTIDGQCGDVRLAWDKREHILSELVVPIAVCSSDPEAAGGGGPDNNDGWVGNVIMGHSSGAHVALLILVDWIGEQMKNDNISPATSINSYNKNNNTGKASYPWTPDYFVGLSGPYDIGYHFDFEAGRGVEQISPMKPICGHSRDSFDRASPVKRLLSLFREQQRTATTTIQQLTPPILLVHGVEDSTVPFTATADAGRMLRSCGLKKCDEMYLDETNHEDVIMHFMLGGLAKDLVLGWLLQCSGNVVVPHSRNKMEMKM